MCIKPSSHAGGQRDAKDAGNGGRLCHHCCRNGQLQEAMRATLPDLYPAEIAQSGASQFCFRVYNPNE